MDQVKDKAINALKCVTSGHYRIDGPLVFVEAANAVATLLAYGLLASDLHERALEAWKTWASHDVCQKQVDNPAKRCDALKDGLAIGREALAREKKESDGPWVAAPAFSGTAWSVSKTGDRIETTELTEFQAKAVAAALNEVWRKESR